MNKKTIPYLLLVSVIWIAASCSTTQLDQAEQKWTSQNITNYRIEVLVINSVWHAQSHQIIVQNNTVVEATANCIPAPTEAGKCEVRDFSPEEYTVPGLFAQSRTQINSRQSKWIMITYDPTYGFPGQISFDNPDVIDEDWTWRVTTFEILK